MTNPKVKDSFKENVQNKSVNKLREGSLINFRIKFK